MANCYRCGAKLKDTAKICTKCGFIMKGAKPKEDAPVQEAAAPAAAAVAVAAAPAVKTAEKKVKEKPVKEKKTKAEKTAVEKAVFWAKFSLWCGIIACTVGIVVPGFNICIGIAAFACCFLGLGKCSGAGNTMAIIGLALSVVAILGGWAYNVYVGPMIGQMLGVAPAMF